MSKTQASSPFKGGEPAVHHERAARALERLGILCYDVAKPMKECGCQETVFTNSLVGTKTGGRPAIRNKIIQYGSYKGLISQKDIEDRKKIILKYMWSRDYHNQVSEMLNLKDLIIHCQIKTDLRTLQPVVEVL